MSALFLLLLVALGGTVRGQNETDDVAGVPEVVPGWPGPGQEQNICSGDAKPEPSQQAFNSSRVIPLSDWLPRAYLYKGFLTEEECDHVIAKANPRLTRSLVTKNDDGGSLQSDIRTSSGMFFNKGEDDVITSIERRISEWTFLPIANQEALQVLKYDIGQKYEPHVDYFHDPVNTRMGGQRYATVLMYLNNVELGGETVFPEKADSTPKDDTWSDCAKGFLAVKPEKGDALLFFSMFPDGSLDYSSLHYACPVLKGEKWSAPMWVHVADHTKTYVARGATSNGEDGTDELGASIDAGADSGGEDGSGCGDTNRSCRAWAGSGECEKNPQYMLHACKKSCKAC